MDRSAVSKSSRDFHECFKHSVLDDRALANPEVKRKNKITKP